MRTRKAQNSDDNSSISQRRNKKKQFDNDIGRLDSPRLNVHAAAMTGGSGSASTALMAWLWITGLPRSSCESSDGGTEVEVEAAVTTTSLAILATLLDFLGFFPDFDASSSPPIRLFFFFPRSVRGCSSSEVTIWLLAV